MTTTDTTEERRPLTIREREVLDAIIATVSYRSVPPTVRELCEMLGVSSTSTIHTHLTALRRKGYLTVDPRRPRSLVVIGMGQPGRGEMEKVREAVRLGWSRRSLLEYIDSFLAVS